MAIMVVSDGSPGTASAFSAWDTAVAAGDAWRWEGEVALAGRYFYGKAGGMGLTIYIGAQEGIG